MFSVNEYVSHESTEVEGDVDLDEGPHFEVEITVAGTTSRRDALEAAATKILREIADYG